MSGGRSADVSGGGQPAEVAPSAEGTRHRADRVSQSYKGLPIYASVGEHEACFEMVRARLAPGSRCLDLGAGSGAFAQRLADAGHQVQANDFEPSGFQAKGIPLWALDLNQPIPEPYRGLRFDLVAGVELIEHLRDPLRFLEVCRNFCRPGGLVLLATPNTVDPISYYFYLKRGEYMYYNRTCYHNSGHITILPYWLLESHIRRVGLEILDRRSVGRNLPGKAAIARALRWPIQLLVRCQVPKELRSGTCIAYVLRNPDGTGPQRPPRRGEKPC